jgi:hypothetical protein
MLRAMPVAGCKKRLAALVTALQLTLSMRVRYCRALAGLARPSALAWFSRDYITAGLALTMLAMGTSLKLSVRAAASSDDAGALCGPRARVRAPSVDSVWGQGLDLDQGLVQGHVGVDHRVSTRFSC